MKDELSYWLWLTTRENITNQKIKYLLRKFYRPSNVYEAQKQDYAALSSFKDPEIDSLCDKSMEGVHSILEQCERQNMKIITVDDADYPEKLRRIYDMPYVLYYNGSLPSFDSTLTIAMVGSRNASIYGSEVATKLAYDLAEAGVIVVSGLARGIDSFSHRGAINAGGITVAVVGNGLDIVYPRENRELAAFIERHGAIISEYPPGTKPERYHFPQRNRLMSALSEGVLVVEAGLKSGTFITVDFAHEHGKDVFAVPGAIFAKQSEGTNALIKEGAKMVTGVWDILEEFRYLYRFSPPKNNKLETEPELPKRINRPDLSEDENKICSCLSFQPVQVDSIVRQTGLPIAKISSLLTMLELKGIIEQKAFKSFVLVNK